MPITATVKKVFRRRRSRIPHEPGKGDFGFGGPDGGVREPRNPKGAPPADAVQIPEPR